MPRGQYKNLSAALTVDKTIIAPVKRGQALGQVTIRLDDQVLAERPLVALQSIGEGGLVQLVKDNVLLMFE